MNDEEFETRLKNLRAALKRGMNRPDAKIDSDPLDYAPGFGNRYNKKLNKRVSEAIVAYSKDHTLQQTADYFGVGVTTVKNHRAGNIKFEDQAYINSSRCAVAREMRHDGIKYPDIAERFDCHKSSIYYHAVGDCQCDNNVPPATRTRDITEIECMRMREMHDVGVSMRRIEERTGRAYHTVRYHVKGECAHVR